jgi:predicted MFS family arabinose efflux permease
MNKEKLLLLTLATINFTHIMDFMIMMPLGPQLMRLFEIDPKQFGLIVSAYTFSAGVFGFAGAFFIDKFDRKSVLLSCYAGFTLGTFACAMTPSYILLVAARIFTGAFGGVLSALILSVIGDVIPEERRGAAMGFVMAAFSFASVLGVPFGLYLATVLSWHAPFYLLGAIGVIVTGLIWKYMSSMRGHIGNKVVRISPLRIITNVTSDKNQMRALLLTCLLMLGQFSVIPFISPYMVANVGFSERQLTFIYLIGGLFTIFSSPMVGKLADRKGKFPVFRIFILLSLIPIFLITNMPPIAVPVALVVTSAFFICSNGRMIPSMAMVTSTVKAQNRGSFMSFNSCIQQISAGVASFVAGMIITETEIGTMLNYDYVGYLAIAFSLVSIIIAKKLKPVEEAPQKLHEVVVARE